MDWGWGGVVYFEIESYCVVLAGVEIWVVVYFPIPNVGVTDLSHHDQFGVSFLTSGGKNTKVCFSLAYYSLVVSTGYGFKD